MPIVKKQFIVEGMHCGSCAVSIGMILKNVQGVISARADFDTKTVQVEYDTGQVAIGDMSRAIEGLGYRLKEA